MVATRRLSWFLVLFLAAVFVGAVAYALRLRAGAGRGLPDYSVYSEEANGLGEAARLLAKLGWEPIALTRPVQQGRREGLLVVAEPAFAAPLAGHHFGLPEGDARSLLRWVEAGNTLLYCASHASELHEALDVPVLTDEAATPDDVFVLEAGAAGSYTEDMRRVAVEGKNALPTSRGLPLWWQGDRPGAVVVKHGRGRVILVADASPLTARGLRREDNAVFLYNVALRHARGGRVYFDEYHHGLSSGGGFFGYLAYHGAHLVLVPVLLAAAAAAWSLAARLGPAVPTPRATRADAVDYASAVARIYERAGARRLPARALVRGFLGALTSHLRLRRNALPAEVLAAWRQQNPGDSGERLQALLRGVSELRKRDVTEPRLLSWSRAFDQFAASLGGPTGPKRRNAIS